MRTSGRVGVVLGVVSAVVVAVLSAAGPVAAGPETMQVPPAVRRSSATRSRAVASAPCSAGVAPSRSTSTSNRSVGGSARPGEILTDGAVRPPGPRRQLAVAQLGHAGPPGLPPPQLAQHLAEVRDRPHPAEPTQPRTHRARPQAAQAPRRGLAEGAFQSAYATEGALQPINGLFCRGVWLGCACSGVGWVPLGVKPGTGRSRRRTSGMFSSSMARTPAAWPRAR